MISFLQLNNKYGSDNISIQSFEDKSDVFIIRINVPDGINKAEEETSLENNYKLAHELTLKAKDDHIMSLRREIEDKRQENAELRTVLIRVTLNMAEQQSSKYVFYNPQVGTWVDTAQSGSHQRSINNQYNYTATQNQTLAEIAVEIQQCVAQLQEGVSSEVAQEQVANDYAIQAQNNPNFKNKLQKWGQNLADAATNGVIGSVAFEVLKLTLRLLGMQIP